MSWPAGNIRSFLGQDCLKVVLPGHATVLYQWSALPVETVELGLKWHSHIVQAFLVGCQALQIADGSSFTSAMTPIFLLFHLPFPIAP